MSKTIYRYVLREAAANGIRDAYDGLPLVVQMPAGAQVIDFTIEHGAAAGLVERTVRVIVDPDQPKVRHDFVMYGTGWTMPDDPGRHVGTAHDHGFVWHLFEPPK